MEPNQDLDPLEKASPSQAASQTQAGTSDCSSSSKNPPATRKRALQSKAEQPMLTSSHHQAPPPSKKQDTGMMESMYFSGYPSSTLPISSYRQQCGQQRTAIGQEHEEIRRIPHPLVIDRNFSSIPYLQYAQQMENIQSATTSRNVLHTAGLAQQAQHRLNSTELAGALLGVQHQQLDKDVRFDDVMDKTLSNAVVPPPPTRKHNPHDRQLLQQGNEVPVDCLPDGEEVLFRQVIGVLLGARPHNSHQNHDHARTTEKLHRGADIAPTSRRQDPSKASMTSNEVFPPKTPPPSPTPRTPTSESLSPLTHLPASLRQSLLRSTPVEQSFLLLLLQQSNKEWYGLAKAVLSQVKGQEELDQIQAWLLHQKAMEEEEAAGGGTKTK